MPEATVNGVRLAYDVHGEGEPVVLIAATGLSGALAAAVAEVVQAEPAPAVAVQQPTAPAPTATASVDIDAMLRAAGLQMAVTNPERLRAVQAEQAAVVPAPRVPRERKPLPLVSHEPLQQVETRR